VRVIEKAVVQIRYKLELVNVQDVLSVAGLIYALKLTTSSQEDYSQYFLVSLKTRRVRSLITQIDKYM